MATKARKAEQLERIPNISIGNARIGFRNFSGKEGKFNAAGRRNFCVFLDSDVAKELERTGWNIKWLQPRDEEEEKQAYIQVAVSYKVYPPKIVVIRADNKLILEESSVHILDWAEFLTIDLVIRPYSWEANGKTGIKAYLKAMYATLVEDEFEKKYVDVPDAAIPSHENDD
jgi:hypothetical protein